MELIPEPREGHLYSCKDMGRMHGGNLQSTLPVKEGEVTLIRFKRVMNPDGPEIMDHGDGPTAPKKIEALRATGGLLPVYEYRSAGAWRYLGRYEVGRITDGGRIAEERTQRCGRPIRYVIDLRKPTHCP